MEDCPCLFPLSPMPSPLPTAELPATRLMESSAEYLTDSELLSVILSHRAPQHSLSLARELLAQYGSLRDLAAVSPPELARVRGIGQATACAIHAALNLGQRLQRQPGKDRPRIQSPSDVADLLLAAIAGKPQEEFHVLLLDTRNHVMRDETATVGLVDRTQIHAREVFRRAIAENCSRVLLVHNHPTGDPTPSPQDIDCTRALVAAGKVVGIEVLDHVILGVRTPSRPTPWVSFRESNLL